ncbi:amidohydrolase [Botrytis cinerea]
MPLTDILNAHRPELSSYEALYKHFHSNPELSNQEIETSATIVNRLSQISSDFEIKTNIGVMALPQFCIMVPAHCALTGDMDALPIEERTGLPYASTKRVVDVHGKEQPVMHACGHDMHITCLLAYAELMVSARDSWHGTIVLIFQPAEERGTGAQIFSGHVVPARAGVIGIRPGTMASSCDNLRVTFHGRGGHASMPERLIDPIVMASSAVMRLQTLVSREVHPSEHAVVTCASFISGSTTAENVVSDDATITIDIRANDETTRQKLYNGVLRIVKAESAASNAVVEPTITPTRSFPITYNDGKAFHGHFRPGDESYIADYPRLSFSEDFCILASAVERPSLLFAYGCTTPEKVDLAQKEGTLAESIPGNHSSLFAPQIFLRCK